MPQLQEQLAPAANKEFDPLGPLPQGWGKALNVTWRHVFHLMRWIKLPILPQVSMANSHFIFSNYIISI